MMTVPAPVPERRDPASRALFTHIAYGPQFDIKKHAAPASLPARQNRRLLVRLVQRALFWYTPQIRISIDGIVRLFHQYIDRLEEYIRLDRHKKEISREQIADLSTKIAGVEI